MSKRRLRGDWVSSAPSSFLDQVFFFFFLPMDPSFCMCSTPSAHRSPHQRLHHAVNAQLQYHTIACNRQLYHAVVA